MAYEPYRRDGIILVTCGIVLLVVSIPLKFYSEGADLYWLLHLLTRLTGLGYFMWGAYLLNRARGQDPNVWSTKTQIDRYIDGLIPPESDEQPGCNAEEFAERYFPAPPSRREAALRCRLFFEGAIVARALPNLRPQHHVREDLQFQTDVNPAEKAAFLSTCLGVVISEREIGDIETFNDLVTLVGPKLEQSKS